VVSILWAILSVNDLPFNLCQRRREDAVRALNKGNEVSLSLRSSVVITILGLLAAPGGPRLFGKVSGARQGARKRRLRCSTLLLDTFRLDVGSIPEHGRRTEGPSRKAFGVEGWQGPYLPKEIPVDPGESLTSINAR